MGKTNKNINIELSDCLKTFKRDYTTQYPGFPDNWLRDEETAIEWIVEKDAERCREIVQLSVNTIDAIEDLLSSTKNAFNHDIKNNNLDPWPTSHLFFLVIEFHNKKDKSDLVERSCSKSLTMTILGLTALWVLANRRYFRHLKDKGTYNQLLVWSADLPSEYSIARPKYIEVARRELSFSAMYKYNEIVVKAGTPWRKLYEGKDTSDEKIMTSFIWENLKKITKVDKILNMAERGHKYLWGTAIAAARDLIDERKKFKELLVGDNKELQAHYANFEDPFIGANLEEFKALESLMNTIENPEDKDIVLLKYQGFTLREIEEETSIPRNTIARRLKRLSTIK